MAAEACSNFRRARGARAVLNSDDIRGALNAVIEFADALSERVAAQLRSWSASRRRVLLRRDGVAGNKSSVEQGNLHPRAERRNCAALQERVLFCWTSAAGAALTATADDGDALGCGIALNQRVRLVFMHHGTLTADWAMEANGAGALRVVRDDEIDAHALLLVACRNIRSEAVVPSGGKVAGVRCNKVVSAIRTERGVPVAVRKDDLAAWLEIVLSRCRALEVLTKQPTVVRANSEPIRRETSAARVVEDGHLDSIACLNALVVDRSADHPGAALIPRVDKRRAKTDEAQRVAVRLELYFLRRQVAVNIEEAWLACLGIDPLHARVADDSQRSVEDRAGCVAEANKR